MENSFDELNDKYMLVPDPFDPIEGKPCVKILDGPFKDIVYRYGMFKIDSIEGELATATYEYDIILVPDDIKDKQFSDEEGEELEYLIGEILIELLSENYDQISKHANEGESGVAVNENRTTNSITIYTQ